jgi:hypothetical protein
LVARRANDLEKRVGTLEAGGGGSGAFLVDDGTASTAGYISAGSGALGDGDKGDVTVSSTGSVWTIDPGAVTNSKLANVATATFKGRTTAGTGAPEDLTATQATALLNAATTSLQGVMSAADKTKLDGISSGATNAWTLAGSWTWTTNVTEVDFTGLGTYNQFIFIARNVTAASSGVRQLLASVNNGSSFYSASGDYQIITPAGVETAGTGFNHSTASTAARTLALHIQNTKGAVKLCNISNNTGGYTIFTASASDIDALRFNNSAGGNLTAGSAYLFAR